MSARKLFITGTDTDIGKTVVALTLIEAIKQRGYSVAGLKPVAAGAAVQGGKLVNEDAAQLHQASTTAFTYHQVNPFLLAEPIAPHIAAKRNDTELSVQNCIDATAEIMRAPLDFVVIEGAGGWLVPLNDSETFADLALSMRADVVVVVGVRLGCINHALLTAAAIRSTGCRMVGWVANHLSTEMDAAQANVDTLRQRMTAPLIAEIPYDETLNYSQLASNVDVGRLAH